MGALKSYLFYLSLKIGCKKLDSFTSSIQETIAIRRIMWAFRVLIFSKRGKAAIPAAWCFQYWL